jgi:hypothetical protein
MSAVRTSLAPSPEAGADRTAGLSKACGRWSSRVSWRGLSKVVENWRREHFQLAIGHCQACFDQGSASWEHCVIPEHWPCLQAAAAGHRTLLCPEDKGQVDSTCREIWGMIPLHNAQA